VPRASQKTQKVVKDQDQAPVDEEEEEPEFYSALGATQTQSRIEMGVSSALQDGSSNLNK
jgi:hypothetical protein